MTYTEDGYVHAILVSSDRPKPTGMPIADGDKVGLFDGLICYSGTYRVERNTVFHTVELSWNELWTGHDQIRYFEMDVERLRITTAPAADLIDGEVSTYIVEWIRDSNTA